MKVYKGTAKDMKCRGYQYKLGEKVTADDAIRCGDKGFHSCEAPLDVLRYYPLNKGNRYFVAEAGGKIDRDTDGDTKLASSELTLVRELSLQELIRAQRAYTEEKAQKEGNLAGGERSNLAGGERSTLAGGERSNLAGDTWSNLAGGDMSNLAGGTWSTLAGGERSTLAGGGRSTLAGGDGCTLAGGNMSTLAGGDGCTLAGGYSSIIVGKNGSKAKGGMWSVLVLTEWGVDAGTFKPLLVKAVVVDGVTIKPDTWYRLKDGVLEAVET